MKILLVHPSVHNDSGYVPSGLSMLSAVLKKAGHEVLLFDTTFYDFGGSDANSLGAGILNFKNVTFPKEVYERKKTLKEDFLKTIEDYQPELIGFSALSTMIHTTEKLADWAKESYPNIPIIVGGKHATVAPDETIQYPSFDFLCVGEGEEALLELVNKMVAKDNLTNIQNIWTKIDGVVFKNPVRPLIQDLDSLPYPDLSIWDKRQLLKPFKGKVYKAADFFSSIGCSFNCSYCINQHLHDLYGLKGFYRQKSPERIVAEVKHMKEEYGIEFLKFNDEDFLMRNVETLRKISKLYREEVNLPFVIEINANNTTLEKAQLLKDMNCVSASVGLECGNEEYRKTVLNRRIPTNKAIIEACGYLNQVGIQTVSFNMLGTPFHTRGLIMESIELNRKAKFKIASAGLFYPYKGSPIRDVCIQYNFIDASKEREEMNTRSDTIMKMWTISPEELKGLLRTFVMYTKAPKWMYPLIKLGEADKPLNNAWFKILRKFFYFKIHVLNMR
jgi:anaerobic magnesium-protoporphyrin IX monomethyl ester cyclase